MARDFYTKADGDLAQGDIAFSYVSQVVPRKPQKDWPGGTETADLPSYGDYHELDGPTNKHGYPDYRVRVWPIRVAVLTQGCELRWAHDQDSRVVVAPIIGESSWDSPELWRRLEAGELIPGFFYLPALEAAEADELGLEGNELGPAVVDLAAASLASREMMVRRRIARIAPPEVVGLQDAISRAYSVRGLAKTADLAGLEGRTILGSNETGLISQGPVRLVKVHLSGVGDAGPDEVTVAWGLRPSRVREE